MPNWLGDCVMAMPALRRLAESMPRARIFLAGREQFSRFFRDQEGVSGFVPAPSSGFGRLIKGMSGTKRAAREAGLPAVDLGILFTNSLSTAAWMWRIGARRRLGYDLDCRRFFLTHPVPCGEAERSWHFVQYYLWLAMIAPSVLHESGTTPSAPVECLPPSIRVGDASREAALALLRERGFAGRQYAVIAPASAYGPVKDWPPDHYRELVKSVNRDAGLPVVVTGGADQADVCQAIADGQKAAVNLAGKTRLDEFAGLLAGASLFVGGDSGGAHAAGA
ncbi:MAG: glycosyltransferase family 9 protein, partial [Planctomycetota bacterium]|nr:glycosyltransferase family 9 protein [Planctomycetota bacterium]